jgi:hypothetical protein
MSWEPLIEEGRASFADPEFDQRERSYKLAIADPLRNALEVAREDGDWSEALKGVFRRSHAGAHYNLSDWCQHDWLFNLEGGAREAARAALAGFLETDKPSVDRFRAFAEVAERFAQKPGSYLGVHSAQAAVNEVSRVRMPTCLEVSCCAVG